MGHYRIKPEDLDRCYTVKIANRYYGRLVAEVQRLLRELNFNVSSIGFNYWVLAIIDFRRNYYKFNNTMENVYDYLALQFNTTRTRVERAMRTARLKADADIKEHFNYNNKLTNKTVLVLLSQQFYILQNDNHIPHID